MNIRIINEQYDHSGMKDKIIGFPNQIKVSWEKGIAVNTDNISQPGNIVISGMGGSAIAGDLLADLLFENLEVPLIVNRGYTLPSFVDNKTLLLISSYSGNTEETLESLKQGIKRNAMIVVFTSNGEIEKIALDKGFPIIIFPQGYPPRSALGFSVFSMLGLLKQLFSIPLKDHDIESLTSKLALIRNSLVSPENEISRLAENLQDRIVLIYITRRLKSVALRWQTQINENSKSFAHINVMPEMNHNEIVGLEFPAKITKQMYLILLRTETFENEQVRKRFLITEDLLRDSIGYIDTIKAGGSSKLEDMFSLIYKGDFLSYYLSLLLKVDPTPVERIELLKKRLEN